MSDNEYYGASSTHNKDNFAPLTAVNEGLQCSQCSEGATYYLDNARCAVDINGPIPRTVCDYYEVVLFCSPECELTSRPLLMFREAK